MLMLKNFLRSSEVLHINSKKLAKRTVVNLIPEMKLVFQGHWKGIVATLMVNECGFEEDLRDSHICQCK